MTEGRPSTPTRRPATARPRRGTDEPIVFPTPEELEAIERHQVRLSAMAGADVSAIPGGVLILRAGGGLPLNYAALIRWTDQDWERRITEVTDTLRERREWPSVVIAEGLTQPGALTDRLVERGWAPLDANLTMWTRRAAVVPHLDPTLRIEAVTRATAPLYEEVERAIFGLAGSSAAGRVEALEASLAAGTTRAYLVRLHREPVATARLSTHEGIAALSGIGVVERHRGQGLGRLITTIATRTGLALGASLVWLSVDGSNDPARALYESLDYRPAFRWWRMLGPERA